MAAEKDRDFSYVAANSQAWVNLNVSRHRRHVRQEFSARPKIPIIPRCPCINFCRPGEARSRSFCTPARVVFRGERLQVTPPEAITQRTPVRFSADSFGHEYFYDGGLDAGAQIANFLRIVQQTGIVAQKIAHGGFQTAGAKIIAWIVEQGTGV